LPTEVNKARSLRRASHPTTSDYATGRGCVRAKQSSLALLLYVFNGHEVQIPSPQPEKGDKKDIAVKKP